MRINRIKTFAANLHWNTLLSIAFFLIVLFFFQKGVANTAKSSENEALAVAQRSLARAAVSCYAVEGRYSDTYEYLEKNYGVSIDKRKYAVHYEIFAENIMPDITIVPIG